MTRTIRNETVTSIFSVNRFYISLLVVSAVMFFLKSAKFEKQIGEKERKRERERAKEKKSIIYPKTPQTLE